MEDVMKNGIEKLGPGKYRVRVTRRVQGRRVVRKRICSTRKEAEVVRLALRDELDRFASGELPQMQSEVTLTDFAQRWIERKAHRLKPSTARKYLVDLERHILPRLGERYVASLRPSDVHDYLASDKGSANNRRNRLALLRQLAKDSVAEGVADLDWTARVPAPAVSGYTEDNPNLLTAAELVRFLPNIPPRWSCMVHVLTFTGMRFGEASALRWGDLDLAMRTARIRRTNWRGQALAPKTAAARRTVPLVHELVPMLEAHRQAQLAAGHPGLAEGWVFPTGQGTLYKGSPLRAVLDRACAAAGVTRITTHGLRRTFNNQARQSAGGMVVRAIVGHTDEAMTEHYSQVSLAEKHAAAAEVARAVFGHAGVPAGVPAGLRAA